MKRILALLLIAGFAYGEQTGGGVDKNVIVDKDTGVSAGVDANGNLQVLLQDQATEPIDALFAQSQSNFTLSTNATASDVTNLVYTFTATAGHGISATDEILLLDVTADRSFYAEVISVATNDITLDRPIDHAFPTNTLGRIVSTDMAVDGSVTPQIFSLRSGVTETDITRFLITMLDATSMDDGKFGGGTALTRGLVLRVVDGYQATVFNFKTNGDIAAFCYDTKYADKAPGGQYGFAARITFAGQDKHGIVFRVSNADVIQWIVQDDLTGLDLLRVVGQGHKNN